MADELVPERQSPPPQDDVDQADNVANLRARKSSSSIRLQSRSPHPYHRLKADLTAPTTNSSKHDRFRSCPPSESGTEADDENEVHAEMGEGMVIRALPAPPFRPRKGLRAELVIGSKILPTGVDDEGDTRARGMEKEEILEGEVFRLSDVGLDERVVTAVVGRRLKARQGDDGEDKAMLPEAQQEQQGAQEEKKRRSGRRRAEILRRVLEGLLVGALGFGVLAVQSGGIWWNLQNGERGTKPSCCKQC
jgi:hypothetical protein